MNKCVALKGLIEAFLAKKIKFLWLKRVLVISLESIGNEKYEAIL